jgi:hypothetical protein
MRLQLETIREKRLEKRFELRVGVSGRGFCDDVMPLVVCSLTDAASKTSGF